MNTGSREQRDLYPGETAWKHEIKIKMIKVWNIKVPSHQEGREKRAERGEEGRGERERVEEEKLSPKPGAVLRRSRLIRTRVCKYVCVCSSVRCCVFFLLLACLLKEHSTNFYGNLFQHLQLDDIARVSWGSSSSLPDDVIMMSSRLRYLGGSASVWILKTWQVHYETPGLSPGTKDRCVRQTDMSKSKRRQMTQTSCLLSDVPTGWFNFDAPNNRGNVL